MHSAGDLVMCLGRFNGYVGRHVYGFDVVHVEYGVGQRNLEGRMLSWFCREKELCVSITWFRREERREEKRKGTYRMGGNEREIDFVLINKGHSRFLRNGKAICGVFQHALVIADIDKRK